MKSIYWIVRNKETGVYFVGTGGVYGGSTARRGKDKPDIPPKLYGSEARARGAVSGAVGKNNPQWEIVAVHLEVQEPNKMVP